MALTSVSLHMDAHVGGNAAPGHHAYLSLDLAWCTQKRETGHRVHLCLDLRWCTHMTRSWYRSPVKTTTTTVPQKRFKETLMKQMTGETLQSRVHNTSHSMFCSFKAVTDALPTPTPHKPSRGKCNTSPPEWEGHHLMADPRAAAGPTEILGVDSL